MKGNSKYLLGELDLILFVTVCVSGGSLNDAIMKKEVQGELFLEAELKDLLLQVSMGLKYIHSLGLVHLDIKPSESHWVVCISYIVQSKHSPECQKK